MGLGAREAKTGQTEAERLSDLISLGLDNVSDV